MIFIAALCVPCVIYLGNPVPKALGEGTIADLTNCFLKAVKSTYLQLWPLVLKGVGCVYTAYETSAPSLGEGVEQLVKRQHSLENTAERLDQR